MAKKGGYQNEITDRKGGDGYAENAKERENFVEFLLESRHRKKELQCSLPSLCGRMQAKFSGSSCGVPEIQSQTGAKISKISTRITRKFYGVK